MSTITHTFEADIQKLLHILIRSVYSNRDVFLRELVSNASDAIDKVRVLKVNAAEDTKGEYSIHVRLTDKTLEIFDTGIGMDKEDLQKNLSTIAHSGTNDFVEQLKDKTDLSQFIGQFGVGFYSCFLVSEDVEVITKKWGTNEVWKWTSDGVSTYTIEPFTGEWTGEMAHGTFIRILLKEDSEEYADQAKLKEIIQQHSSFISYPIQLWTEKEREEEKPVLEAIQEEVEEETTENEKDVVVEEGDDLEKEDEDKEVKTPEKIVVKYHEWEQVNGAKPLWYKEPSEIEEEDYKDLYRAIKKNPHPMDDVLYWKHFKAEGKQEFQGIFFLSRKPTVDQFNPANLPEKNIRLYVKKVMIMENCGSELIPDWMCFVSGIVDSNDLPLNVSREMLQNNKLVRSMKSYMTKQVMKMLGEFIEKDRSKYEQFYENNGKFLKWGVTEGESKLMDFLLWHHSKEGNEMITLDDYIEKHLAENQKQIFYLTGESVNEMKASFCMERFLERDITVLLFVDAIDEFIVQHVKKYKDFDLVDIGKEFETTLFDDLKQEGEEVKEAMRMPPPPPPPPKPVKKEEDKGNDDKENDDNDGDDKGNEETKEEDVKEDVQEEVKPKKPFLQFVMDSLEKEAIDKVTQSIRLKETPACVIAKKYGWTGHMEKIMKAQPLQDKSMQMMAQLPKIFEINLNHKMVTELKQKYEDESVTTEELSKRINVLYKISTLQSGYPLKDGPSFCRDLFQLLDM